MKGDRIVITNSTTMGQTTDEVYQVYKPVFNSDGSLATGYDGTVLIEKSGGVKTGSTGYIADDPIMVHKAQLPHLVNESTSIGGKDLIPVYPIYFDDYKLVGWISTDRFRVVGGSAPGAPRK